MKNKTTYLVLSIMQVILYILIAYYFTFKCKNDLESFITFFVSIVGYYVIIFISNALHELGHLIGGLIVKYDFFMYSVGGFSIYKSDNNKLKFTRTNIAGAGGFVSMMAKMNSNYRIFLYGGITVNFIIALICTGLLFIVSMIPIRSLLSITILYNFYSLIVNYCPIQVGNVNTDGMKIKDLDSGIYKIKDYVRQSKFDKYYLLGTDFKDIEYNEFYLPKKRETFYEKNDFSAYMNKLIREGKFEDTIKLFDDYKLIVNYNAEDTYDLEVTYEIIFLKLMLNKIDDIEEIFTKENINFMKKSRNQFVLSANRCLYYYFLLKNDEKNIKNTLKYKKVLLKKSFKSQIPYENYLYDLIDKKLKNKKSKM